jgi:rhodanese-related sulfurtransferase
MRRTFERALLIVVAGALLGLTANGISPRRIPYITPPLAPPQAQDTVPLKEAQELWTGGSALFLDARSPSDYAAGHIAGALSLPVEEFEDHFAQVSTMFTTDSTIVAYCDGVECDLSHRLMDKLRGLGYHNVRLLVNGWTTWHTAGLPAHTGDQP